MKIDKDNVNDRIVYDIMYFSPVEVGDERNINLMYFQTEIYARTWPTTMVAKMAAQIENLKHCELGIVSFDDAFKHKHRDVVIFHCKMALAYLDARQARIAMKLCEVVLPATRSSEPRIQTDPDADLDTMRVVVLSVMACAARRVKFYQKAVDALDEAKTILLAGAEENKSHPLMTAITLLSLSAVLGDIDHDEHALRWGLEALAMLYNLFSSMDLPEQVQAYYLALACHNAALLNVKLGRWPDASELVSEGIEFTKTIGEFDDGLRRQLIAIGAQAKHVPEGFLVEAVNALNGWGEERGVWNLSFWDHTIDELKEEIHVLENTMTLRHIIIEHIDDDRRIDTALEDEYLNRLFLAACNSISLEMITICGIDFDPRNVWKRIRKRGFLETSWYASAMNFSNVREDAKRPDSGQYQQLLKNLSNFAKKLVITLVTLGNETEGVDLSENGIDMGSITALVCALRFSERPARTRPVKSLILRNNELDPRSAAELARVWHPLEGEVLPFHMLPDLDEDALASDDDERVMTPLVDADPGVISLDVSQNPKIGCKGFEELVDGVARYKKFKVFKAENIGLQLSGCMHIEVLCKTRLEILSLSENNIGSDGAELICKAASKCSRLRVLQLDQCGIQATGAPKALADLVRNHDSLKEISLAGNNLADEGTIEFCSGASESHSLEMVNLASNNIVDDNAAEAIGDMMRNCETLTKMILSGNHLDATAPPQIGSAIEHSHILTMHLEDMGFNADSIDDFLDHGAAETQDLQVMVLNKNPVGDEGLTIIAECLSIGLTDLGISRCSLTSESHATLLNLVSLSPNLRSLDLSYNELGPHGCSDMVAWMTQNDTDSFSLRTLELAGCGLGDEGFVALMPVLGSLHYLGLRENGIKDAGMEVVLNSPTMVKLQVLDLGGNMIGEGGVHALTERFQQEHKRSLWNPKQLTSMIDTVILSDNKIAPSLAASTETFLKIHNPLMTVIW